MADYSRFLGGDVAGGSGMRSAGNPGAAFGGELEAGISGSGVSAAFSSPYSPPYTRRRASYRTMGGSLSPRSAAGGGNDDGGAARFFFDSACGEEPRHFLDACFLCKKPLGSRDIFMYRGDTPFCSEECRQEQIEMDETKEKSRTLSMKAASSRKEQKQNQDADKASLRIRATGTVVAG